ncbi:MAG: hypothetical protein PVI59_06095 [Anaerolineae bacterium]|jgi:hypothetical protein
MARSSRRPRPAALPVTRSLTLVYIFSLIIALLMTVASAVGLLFSDQLYPTEELWRSLVATDVLNLCIGLPILLGSIWCARRGKLLGLLFWPGALFYVLYHYIVYSFALPLNIGFLFSLLLLTLSAYTMAGLVASIDTNAVERRLSGAVLERVTGGVLAGLGIAFALLAIGTVLNGIVTRTPIPQAELALQISDSIVSGACIIGGVLLWRREPLGYVTGAGLLFQVSMLFIGLLVHFILQPFLTGAPFPMIDFVVVFVMGLICFIPFVLFLRGVIRET